MSAQSETERITLPMQTYLLCISDTETYFRLKDAPYTEEVVSALHAEAHLQNHRLKDTLILTRPKFAQMSHRFAQRLAALADQRLYAFSQPLEAAVLFQMASGAERVSRKNLATEDHDLKNERASLQLIYMADAVNSLVKAAASPQVLIERNHQSLQAALEIIEIPGAVHSQRPGSELRTDLLGSRLAEAYRRGHKMLKTASPTD